jgi:hypothetical protein
MADSPSLENNTIKLSVIPKERHEEGVVFYNVTIYPGMFVQLANVFTPEDQQEYIPAPGVHLANPFFEAFIAVENPYYGKTIHDAHEGGERIMVCSLRPGDIVLSKVTDLTAWSGDLRKGHTLTHETAVADYGWLMAATQANFLAGTERSAGALSLDKEDSATLPRWTRIRIL